MENTTENVTIRTGGDYIEVLSELLSLIVTGISLFGLALLIVVRHL